MMKTFFSIKAKAWFIFIMISIVSITLMIGLTAYLYQELYLNHETERLETQVAQLKELQISSTEKQFQETVEWIESTSASKVIYTDDPMLLGSALPLIEREADLVIKRDEREQLLNGKNVVLYREHKQLNTDLLGIATPIMERGMLSGIILIYTPISELNESLRDILPLLIIIGALAFLFLFYIMKKIEKNYIQPVIELDQATQKLKEGKFDTNISVTTKNELSRLSESFRSLAESLKQEEEKKREFIQNISHELRTPLSYIKGYSELLRNHDPEQKEYANIIINESDRMHRLVEQLIQLTRLEKNEGLLKFGPVVISEVVYEALNNTKVKRVHKQQKLTVEMDESMIVSGDEDRLLQIFVNLIDNAIVYSKINGEIMVRGWEEKGSVFICIEDYGVGMSEKDLEQITERFYRADKARTREEGGFGIGLSIVKQLVDLHHGTIHFESVLNKGTKVTVKLPKYEEHEKIFNISQIVHDRPL
ncbi:HAMP domain-containing histidine kinase [Bacillus shivajii]|uniref:sensor histidine kinase n=1 Tax=Bacillus shivajii TaxID=1983719 RepID=UPI001CFBF8B1|nr:HAMP domain-containing sensor histidine kinase [Bacillus shivajii]UCZ52586.1 HAMP domain-containing histidine kinase [Bacillus shivajii]